MAVCAASALAQVSPLRPEQAFRFSAKAVDKETVEARFTIADGYYLYREKIHFALEPPKGALFTPALPAGLIKQDEFFGRVETYRNSMVVNLSLKNVPPGQSVVIRAESQGCADIGICYLPTVQSATVSLPAGSVAPNGPAEPVKNTWFN